MLTNMNTLLNVLPRKFAAYLAMYADKFLTLYYDKYHPYDLTCLNPANDPEAYSGWVQAFYDNSEWPANPHSIEGIH